MHYWAWVQLVGIGALGAGTNVLCGWLERRYGAVSTREALVGCGRIVVGALRAVGHGSWKAP